MLLAPAACSPGRAEVIRIATWNLEHLAENDGAGCRARATADYARLRRYVDELDADVIAFQEVESEAAAARVFDPARYAIEISRRPGREDAPCHRNPRQRQTPIKVGFAIRRDLDYIRSPDLRQLAQGRRHGVDITLRAGGTSLRLLAVHLASGCYSNRQDRARDRDCEILDRQIPFVERWLDARTRKGQPAIALGDFNRRLTLPGDRVWQDLNDADPAHYALLTFGQVQHCNGPYDGAPHIDHLIANPPAFAMLRSRLRSLRFVEGAAGQRPSDHCPLAIDLEIRPRAPGG